MRGRRSRINIIPIVVITIIILTGCTVSYKFKQNKYKDINFTAQRYLTTGLLNKYKMYKIDTMDLSFSDGSLAIMTVTGLQNKAPHKGISYRLFLEKNKAGVWKVKSVYK